MKGHRKTKSEKRLAKKKRRAYSMSGHSVFMIAKL